MSRVNLLAALLAGSLAPGAAHAGSWADYEGAFPMFPCNDGWMACVVDGTKHTPEPVADGGGMPAPASWRVSWFDLAPTAAFSPFGGLSSYTGEAPPGMGDDGAEAVAAAEPVPEPAIDPAAEEAARRAEEESQAAAEAQERAAEEAEAAAAASAAAQEEAQRQAEAARRAEEEAAQASAEEKARLEAEAEAARQAAAEAEAARKAAEEAEAKREEEARLAAEAAAKAEEEKRKAEEERQRLEEEAAAAAAAAAAEAEAQAAVADAADPGGAAPPPPPSGDCGDLVKLEPMAMLGKMDDGAIASCEARLTAASQQTEKDKISRLLMTNAFSKGDKKEWERLVKRHLNEIDRSDPDLCYKYALHLNRKGPGAANGVIRWADVSLENRMVWTGDTYVKRVYSLYKLKSVAAQKLWKKAEEAHAASPSDQTQADIEKHRNQTKVFAREWYEYAKTSGKDTNVPLQLCTSAAGTADYCEAG